MPESTARRPLLRHVLSLIALIAGTIALGTQPASSDKTNTAVAPQDAALPPAGDIDVSPNLDAVLPPDIELTRRVKKGDTLASILVKAGADKAEAQEAMEALRRVYDPRGLAPNEEVILVFERLHHYKTGRLLSVELPAGTDFTVRVERADDEGFKASKTKKALSQSVVRAAGTIDSSLYLSAAKAGLPTELVAALVRVFSWDVDFQRDIQPGDGFDVLYQRVTDEEGAFVRSGDMLYASLTLSGVRHSVYRFRPPGGTAEYYDAKGGNVRKDLLRTPLDAARISSHFGNRRHPILGYTRMHRGVDFAAPAGTPVYAAGAGTVVARGINAGYGLYVRLSHDKKYDTAYGHLSRFAKGLKPGSRVRQGEVIGYVGSSGLATGPHLHYEVLATGQQVNPLGVKFAGGRALTRGERRAFAQARAAVDRWLAALPAATTVAKK